MKPLLETSAWLIFHWISSSASLLYFFRWVKLGSKSREAFNRPWACWHTSFLKRNTKKRKHFVCRIDETYSKISWIVVFSEKDRVWSLGIVLDLSKILQNVNQLMVICDEQVNKDVFPNGVFIWWWQTPLHNNGHIPKLQPGSGGLNFTTAYCVLLHYSDLSIKREIASLFFCCCWFFLT